jgi:uncharacterized protein
MSLTVNLRHLEADNVHLQGELTVEELDIDVRDEVIQARRPLSYDLEVQKVEDGLLLHGTLVLPLECQCVRCLKTFEHQVELGPWSRHLPLEGEEAARVVSDCVDLTPYIREDILLEFPQHPLCDPECSGLPKTTVGQAKDSGGASQPGAGSSAWAELNKLKF